jgi:uncharacterized protein YwgA
MHTDLISDINQSLEISLPGSISLSVLKEKLTAHINYLINYDFEKLIFYLYRIDVDETNMRRLLEQKEGTDTAVLIANLIIERQLQKIESRKKLSSNENIPDEEKW